MTVNVFIIKAMTPTSILKIIFFLQMKEGFALLEYALMDFADFSLRNVKCCFYNYN
jgi:hypothetical protein